MSGSNAFDNTPRHRAPDPTGESEPTPPPPVRSPYAPSSTDNADVSPLFEVNHGRVSTPEVVSPAATTEADVPPDNRLATNPSLAISTSPEATDDLDHTADQTGHNVRVESVQGNTDEVDAEKAPGQDPTAAAEVEKFAWNLPAAPTAERIVTGPYEGRTAVGNIGEMERIIPRVLPNLRGGHRPEAMVDAGFASKGLFIGAVSVRGPGHHHLGVPRQDHYAVGIEGEWFIGVVADGVSEGELSHLGAERVAYTAVAETRARIKAGALDEQSWPAIGQACRKAVRATALQLVGKHAKDAGGSPVAPETVTDRTLASHVATTCDIVVCSLEADSNGGRTFTRVTVSGDGSAYVLSPRDGWRQVGAGKADCDGMVDNSLIPLPLDPGPPRVTSSTLPLGQALVLCTDGFGDLIEEGSRPVGRYLFERWARPLHADALLSSAMFLNKNADDDRTAIILWAES